jgi:hypothetical protein
VIADATGDVGTYESGELVEDPPIGIDIRNASITTDMHVTLLPGDQVPPPLVGWANESEVLLWVALHEPIPDPPTSYTEWLFALDLDGDAGTGRPVNSARINPDIGMEAAIGAYYDPDDGEYGTYFLAWNPDQGGLLPQEGELRLTIDDSRTVIGLALPLETLSQTVSTSSGIDIVLDSANGRAAALAYVGAQGIIDFYPNRP